MTVDAASILLARHEQMHSRTGAAARVLGLVDDPDTGAIDLARAIGTDPVFAAKVLRVANSSYYGLGGRVSTLPFAVSVVGFQCIRSLAVAAAAGLDDPNAAPEGFWLAAALCATAAETVAGPLDADPGDAFTVGLLHILGAALLHQHQDMPALCVPIVDDGAAMLAEEDARYGIAHDAAAGRVLTAWHMPARICEVIAEHHQALLPTAGSLHRALAAARRLASAVLADEDIADACGELVWITGGRIGAGNWAGHRDHVVERAKGLLDGLQPRT
jgi:HD-like signal output (HDOD) protein